MKELESIVQRMMDAGEPESKIREAVRIYKENKKGKAQDSTVDPTMSIARNHLLLEAGQMELKQIQILMVLL